MTRNFFLNVDLTKIWHSDRGPQWPPNIKNLRTRNSCNSFKSFLKFSNFSLKYLKMCRRDPLDIIFVFQQVEGDERESEVKTGSSFGRHFGYMGQSSKFQKYLNELQKFPKCRFLIFCGHIGPLPLCQISAKSYDEKILRGH